MAEAYVEEALGVMGRSADGKLAMTTVTRRPRIKFATPGVLNDTTGQLHQDANERGGLTSEAGVIKKQARHVQPLNEGENLLKASPGKLPAKEIRPTAITEMSYCE